jgi:tetraacyldisaccharide 4'-kinase
LLGRILEPLYALELQRRNRRYDRGVGVVRAAVPVISVGNLSVGGTGKTPMVMHLARELLEVGRRPAIAMRGYVKGRGSGAHGQASDEARQYRRVLDDVPVVAQPDRAAGIAALIESGRSGSAAAGIDCVLLDDGFQHRRLARDLDIVLIDAARSPFEDRLLPAGWLREPVESLRRADAVVLTHAELVGPDRIATLQSQVTKAHGRRAVAVTRHLWTGLRVAEPARRAEAGSNDSAAHPWANQLRAVEYLADKRLVVVCAIGSPEGFLAAAAAAGGRIVEQIVLPDHDRYAPATVERLVRAARGADVILTTEKDWSKLSRRRAGAGSQRAWPCPVARPILTLTFDEGREALTARVLEGIRRFETSAKEGAR